jgi:class 3 adenylate cyclase
MISRKLKQNLILWGFFILAGGAVGIAYSQVMGGQAIYGFTIGCSLIAGVMGFELFWVQGKYGNWLRALIAACLQYIPILVLWDDDPYGPGNVVSTFKQDMLFSLGFSFVFNAILRVRSLIGGRVFTNFLLGRYHNPVRENRVFMFLDLADSSYLSEKLGDIQVQLLIGRFFFDIAQPIAESGGETHRYIGDEVVVTWAFDDVRKTTTCIKCVFDIQRLIESHAESYRAAYGVIPGFRVGIHGGNVVAGEVGDDKREIVYFGDTVNTAARIRSLCKEKKRDFLVSQDLLSEIILPSEAVSEDMGEVRLRGKQIPLRVHAISRLGSSN